MSAAAFSIAPALPLIGFGRVYHTRLRPKQHRFVYPLFTLLLPMRALRQSPEAAGALAVNRFGALSYWDRDHGDGRGPEQGGALAWLDALLQSQGITDADGEVWLQCLPRLWGYSFKPVSFWFCHRSDGSLRAVVAEVNNTFGERHIYVLDEAGYGRVHDANKVFHVSPFCEVEGQYRFAFKCTGPATAGKLKVRVDYADANGPLLLTGTTARLHPLTPHTRRIALWKYPLMTVAIVMRIHWHALLLWLKGVPFYRKPQAPSQPVSLSSAPH